MQYPHLLFALLAGLFSFRGVYAQKVEQCALNCVSNVNGTGCTASNWPCLCNSTPYIDNLNACTYRACNTTQSQQATFEAIAEICNIFNEPLTASPESTIATPLLTAGNATVSIAIPTSISSEPVTTIITATRNATAAQASSTGLSTVTPTSLTTSASGSSSASATVAQFTGGAVVPSYKAVLHVTGAVFGLIAAFVL